jgi:hypothetical protein
MPNVSGGGAKSYSPGFRGMPGFYKHKAISISHEIEVELPDYV